MSLTLSPDAVPKNSKRPGRWTEYVEEVPTVRSVSTMQLSLLSTFSMRVDGRPVTVPPNVERVVAILAVRGRPEQRLTVASHLWMDTTETRACANLRTALWKARQSMAGCIEVRGNQLALASSVEVDVGHVVERVHRLLDDDEPLRRDDADPGDLLLDLLPDWDEDWITLERERLRQLRIHGLEALCRRLSLADRFAESIDAGLAAVAAEPLRESAQRVLILAHVREGNLVEARRQYVAYRQMLWDELGVEPSETLRGIVGLAATRR